MIQTAVSSSKIHQNETMSNCKLTNLLAYKWPPILSTSYNILNSKPCSNEYRTNPPLRSYMCLPRAVSTNSVQTCSSGL